MYFFILLELDLSGSERGNAAELNDLLTDRSSPPHLPPAHQSPSPPAPDPHKRRGLEELDLIGAMQHRAACFTQP
jgi:hypothetical protein